MGTMPELGVGATAAIHFATLPNIVYPSDVEASGRWFTADVIDPPVTCFDGLLTLPAGPGLGVRLDPTIVDRYKVREWSAPLACRLSLHLQPREA
jgi:O-succinylbenzoate synthase